MSKDPLYIGVSNPVDLRKNVLLCARGVISSLKNYEAYKTVSKEAVETTFELRKTMEELVVLNRKLRLAFPKTKLAQVKKEKKGKTVTKKTISKLTDLEKALDKIEGKLKRMK